MDRIKVIIADDMEDVQTLFRELIDKEPDMETVGTASSARETVEMVCAAKPDIVIMDIQMETEYAGLEAVEMIKQLLPNTKIIMLTMHDDDELMLEAFGLGATDYIIKANATEQLLPTIRSVYNDAFAFSEEITKKLLNGLSKWRRIKSSMLYLVNAGTQLTKSELEILKACNAGMKYTEIAAARFVEPATIKVQVNKILKKFRVHSMKELLATLRSIHFFDVYK